MLTKEMIKSSIRSNISHLKREYKIEEIKLFGSFVRNDGNENSDVDLLVSFSEIIDLIQYVRLKNTLSKLLKTDVDLVMENALKSRIKDIILQEAEVI